MMRGDKFVIALSVDDNERYKVTKIYTELDLMNWLLGDDEFINFNKATLPIIMSVLTYQRLKKEIQDKGIANVLETLPDIISYFDKYILCRGISNNNVQTI